MSRRASWRRDLDNGPAYPQRVPFSPQFPRVDSLDAFERDCKLASDNLLHQWLREPPYADIREALTVIKAELHRREALPLLDQWGFGSNDL